MNGISIALAIHSLDPSLFVQLIVVHSIEGSLSPSLSSQLILPFVGCFGDCLNHGFSLIKRITQIMGSL